MRWLVRPLAALVLASFAGCDKPKEEAARSPAPARVLGQAQKIGDARLSNAYRFSDKVITGAQPLGKAAFQALKELGVKTVISVDGARPDLALAKKSGLRYIHLPIGYDGVPADCASALAKAILELDGPLYVHCHRGTHRGPAAAATACVVAGILSNDEALARMKVVGTSAHYLGLWASAREAKPVPAQDLKQLKVEFKEVAPVPKLAEAMVQLDGVFERLTDLKTAGWQTRAEHPDIDPPHEALRLRELYMEIIRTDEFKLRPDEFKKWMKNAQDLAVELENDLLERKKAGYVGAAPTALDTTYEGLKAACSTCHKTYRNTPHQK